MTIQLSDHLGVNEADLERLDVLDAIVGLDTRLFVDPFLFEETTIPEFAEARAKIKTYYGQILKLLVASRATDDKAWKEAWKRLTFKEIPGVSIGYGAKSGDGNGVGLVLAAKLLKSAKEIIDMGILDPELFELLGLLEEQFGPDRLSDMTLFILKEDFYKFTERICSELKITNTVRVNLNGTTYVLPKHPYREKPIIFLPRQVLKDLPVALSFDDVDRVVSHNEELRKKINEMIGRDWSERVKKSEVRRKVFSSPDFFKEVVELYKKAKPEPYDFKEDPASEATGYKKGQASAKANPIKLSLPEHFTIKDVEGVVKKIIDQFKKNIELNGLNETLFVNGRARHERYSQVAFFAVADSYCNANNLDLSREPSAGSGPVDFKVAAGYKERVLVEIKKSSNGSVLKGYQNQLPAYEKSESTETSFYVILRVNDSEGQIEQVKKIEELAAKSGKRVPHVVVIDARLKPSASKR